MEYADDHIPQTKRIALKPPARARPEAIQASRPPPHDEIVALCVRAIRASPKREPAARVHRLRNYALTLERLADSDEEWEAMRIAADKLRQIAEEILR